MHENNGHHSFGQGMMERGDGCDNVDNRGGHAMPFSF